MKRVNEIARISKDYEKLMYEISYKEVAQKSVNLIEELNVWRTYFFDTYIYADLDELIDIWKKT